MSENSGIIGRILASIAPPKSDGVPARVIALPPTINTASSGQTIEGEVVQQNPDGTVRIRTAQGNIDVQLRGRETLQPGQQVQLEIPKGQPPRQVIVRDTGQPVRQPQQPNVPQTPQAQGQVSQPSQQTTSANTQTQAPATQGRPTPIPGQVQATPTAPPQTPANTSTPQPSSQPLPQTQTQSVQQVLNTLTQNAPSNVQPTQPGQVTRFVPLTPLQTQEILPQLNQPQTIITRVSFQANIFVQRVDLTLQNQLVQISQNSIQNVAQSLAPAQTLVTAPALTPQSTPTPLTQFLNFTPQAIQNTGQNAVTFSPTSNTAPTLTPVTPASIAPITQPATSPVTSIVQTPQTAPFDTRFVASLPQSVSIVPPAQTPSQTLSALLQQVQNPAFSITRGSPQGVPAIVIGTTAQNLPVLAFQPGAGVPPLIAIAQAPLIGALPGSPVQILPQNPSVLTQPNIPPVQPVTPQPLPLPELLRPGLWPALEEINQALLRAAPELAQSLSQSVPNPVASARQLTPAALLFIAAVRSGDFSGWLGGNAGSALQKIGKSGLVSRLSTEMTSLNRGETPIGEWRAMPIPLFYQGEAQRITLYTKQHGQGSKDEEDGDKTRFIFDLDLTRMGPVQLDGYIQDKRLDLIVRTQAPFSEPMRQAMRQSYVTALEDSGLHGDLNFQGNVKQWVNVLKQDSAFGGEA